MRRQHGRVIGWLLLVLILVGGFWAVRQFAPQMLPGSLRPPRPEPGAEATAQARQATPEAQPARNPPLYKWKDDRGQWQITGTPPRGRSYETVRVDPDTNVVPAFVPPVVEEELPEDIDEID